MFIISQLFWAICSSFLFHPRPLNFSWLPPASWARIGALSLFLTSCQFCTLSLDDIWRCKFKFWSKPPEFALYLKSCYEGRLGVWNVAFPCSQRQQNSIWGITCFVLMFMSQAWGLHKEQNRVTKQIYCLPKANNRFLIIHTPDLRARLSPWLILDLQRLICLCHFGNEVSSWLFPRKV